jgi:gliding motility-associated-like protein
MGKTATPPDLDARTTFSSPTEKSVTIRKGYACVLIALSLFALYREAEAQTPYCNAGVPTFTVNMTGNPNGSWNSPNTGRNDYCCGVTGNDACVQFIVTLDPMSTGIIFDIASGAVPPGALFYQINCGPVTQVGQPICLTGVGPHYLSFCKPGGNANTYSISALMQPTAGPNITVNDGCSAEMYCSGFDDTTITWTSVAPGNPGQYNSFLSCTQDCDTVTVTPSGFFPPFVDYAVCGASLGGCGTTPTCDTLRVYFNPPLIASILPVNPTVCFGNTGTTISANVQGGSPPYSYIWSTGATTQSIFVPPGTYSVQVSDTSDCPPTVATVTVGSFTATITANAGPDIHICNNQFPVQLNGAVTGVSTGQWIGGAGAYAPSATAMNATYIPTAGEIAAGQMTLQLITTNNGTCPPDTDAVVLFFHQFTASGVMTSTDVTCFGANNGTATIAVSGGNGPFTYAWNTIPIQTTATATNLSPGTYLVTVTDANGCTGVSSAVTINEPPVLTLSSAGVPASCFAACDGQLVAVPGGGTQPYSLLWNTGCTTLSCTNVCAGTYSVTLTDANGCSQTSVSTVTQPTALVVNTSSIAAHCNQSDGQLNATASGGTPGYSYVWNPGNINSASAQGLTPGPYTLLVTDAQGCSVTVNDFVNNQPGVVAAVSNVTQPLCDASCTGSATGIASAGNGPYTYQWSNATTNQTANGLCPATYTLTVTDADGCSDTAAVVIQGPPPVLVAVVTPPAVCVGQSVTLSASASGGTPGYNYTWSSGSPNVSPTATTTYTVTATDSYGCASAPATITVSVHPPLSVLTNTVSPVCSNSPVVLSASASGGDGAPYTYTWTPGNFTGNAVQVQPSSTTVYTVTVSDGCTSPNGIATVTVTTISLPVVSFISDDTALCEDGCVNFINTSQNSVSWLWNFGDGNTATTANATNCYAAQGDYDVSLTIVDNNGCTNTIMLPAYMTIYANPVADFTLGPQPTTILDPVICFSDHSSSDVIDWYWNFGDPNDQTTSYDQNTCHSYSDTGNYCADLVVHNANGCMSHQQYCLQIDPYFAIFVPNAFSPNGDGLNDNFAPLMFNVLTEGFTMQIYDRWGNLIFETNDIYKTWNGKANDGDRVAQIDTYVWKIQLKDYTGRIHKLVGHVSIIL